MAVNAGWAAIDGYRAYKAGKGWKGVAKAAAKGAIGGRYVKGAKAAYRGAKSSKQYSQLKEHYRQAQKYGKGGQEIIRKEIVMSQ
ncbi:hypothetical protein [Shouchella miscanthi]|uniref:Uncharacterized protein n=1 Tax=Shouchella miscanthi TaxID=2598861 RepID=A0ABU6NPD9_9BACI|nr:hypothetical protein [Shouchella miscanthi]